MEQSAPHGGAREPRAREGAGIGAQKRRGMSVTLKFSLFTLLTIAIITFIFGALSIGDLQNQLLEEIKRSGYQQVLWVQTFGLRVVERLKGQRNEAEFNRILDNYQHPPKADPSKNIAATGSGPDTYSSDLKQIQRILQADKRIQDVAIFASPNAIENPSTPVLRAANRAESFTPPPAASLPLNLENPDPDVTIYWGQYDHKSCLYFRMPLEKFLDKKVYSSVSLILSAEEIDSTVSSLKGRLMLFGLLLAAAGVGVSVGISRAISRPIHTLVEDINTVSQGDLEHESAVPSQTSDEVGLLAMAFNRMTKNLRDARDLERDIERINSELDTAKKIHFNLLPDKLPQLPGLDIANEYKSAKEVGGDYYDFIPTDSQHLAFCIADVSGKGIPGSMVMGTTRNILRMMAVGNLSAADVLAKTNFHVAKDIKRGMFVTCVYAILNVPTREMTVASAGHNPMLVWRAATKTIEKVRPNGIALGFDKGPIFNRTVREQKVKLLHGDRVVMYTDGIVEAMDERRREWSDEALDEFTLKHATLSSKEFVRLLLKALDEHKGRAEQHDDITVTTFRIV